MVERSREQAARDKVAARVEFRVADAQGLPFEDAAFDVVITESVTSFPQGKAKAVAEYAQVTKLDGSVGLAESIWLKALPPPEIEAWVAQGVGATVHPPTAEEWVALLEGVGLRETVAQAHVINPQNQAKGILRRHGLGGTLRVLRRTLRLYARNPAYRAFVNDVRQEGIIPPNLAEYLGYGPLVGRNQPNRIMSRAGYAAS